LCKKGTLPAKTLLLGILACFAVTSLVYAEDDTQGGLSANRGEEDSLFDLSLDALLEVTITGSTLTPESLRTVPAAVTVFTHKQITRLGLDTLDELMNLVPGFQSYQTSFMPQSTPFSSRGRRIFVVSAEILILVDGQRISEIGTGGSVFVTPKIPLMYVERVEFIRGPGSAVYGSNAMLGVVNIITRSDVNELGVSYGSFNRRKGYLLTSQQIGELKMDVFGHIEKDNGDDFRVQDTFSSNRIATDDRGRFTDLNLKLRWRDTHINIQHYQSKTENFYLANTLSNGFNERSGGLNIVSVRQDFEWQAVDSSVSLSYKQTRYNTFSQAAAPGALAAISNPSSNDGLFVNGDFDGYAEARASWHNDWNINDQSSLQFGVELRNIDAPEIIAANNFDLGDLSNGVIPIRYYGAMLSTTPVQMESTRDIVGLYGQYQHKFWETTNLTMGLRYDSFSGIGSELSPRLGLVHELNEHHSLKLLYGSAFRAPTETELNLQNNGILLGNPNLKPETVQTLDVIWVGKWIDTSIALGYFENHYRNSIVESSIGGGASQYSNVDQGPSKGFEFELSHEFNEQWMFRGTFTALIETPDLSFREANHFASAMLNYQKGGFNANLVATWFDEREMTTGGSATNRIDLDDYWLLFAKASYNFNPDYQVFLQAKNMLDENYGTPTANASLPEGTPNRGRELLVGVTVQF
jgi:outer membrane cobalamin receptor